MGIQWFDEGTKQSNDLPWIKDYIEEGGTGDIPCEVCHVYTCPTGLLVITEYWKGFVYNKSKLHTQLSEALNAYVATTDLLPRLMTCANESGRLSLGLDTDHVDAAWVKHGREYSQMFTEFGAFPEEVAQRTNTNLLLPPSLRGGQASNQNGAQAKPKRAKSTP